MARNDILWMARQADREWDCDRNMVEWIEHFAGLVAQMEREACAKVCDDWQNSFEIDTRGWWASAVCAQTIRARGEKPLKREWVGLTDEEIGYELTKEFGQWWGRHVSVCRAIEAKLKEKNT